MVRGLSVACWLSASALGCGTARGPSAAEAVPDAAATGVAGADTGVEAGPPFDAALCAKLRGLAQTYVEAQHAPGVAFRVELKDGATCAGAAGLADLGASTKMTETARFRIGSITKTFVAAVALQLVDEKALALTDTVAKWLPTFPRGAVTIEQLLNHTSGLVDYLFDPSIQSTQARPHTPDELLAVAARVQSGATSPGVWKYSNTNYLLLGRILEAAGGTPWHVQVRKRLLDRPDLGLASTFVYGFEGGPGGFVRGYQRSGAVWEDVTELTHPTVMDAAGCMVSSMPDLGRWWRALNLGQVFSASSLDAMRQHSVALASGERWGLGVESQDGTPLGVLYGHGGGFGGYANQMQYFAGPNDTLTVAVNASIPNGDPLELVDPMTQVHHGIRPQLWQAILGL